MLPRLDEAHATRALEEVDDENCPSVDIAFQTNLLALNAGMKASLAGQPA